MIFVSQSSEITIRTCTNPSELAGWINEEGITAIGTVLPVNNRTGIESSVRLSAIEKLFSVEQIADGRRLGSTKPELYYGAKFVTPDICTL